MHTNPVLPPEPILELRPLRAGVARDCSTTFDLMLVLRAGQVPNIRRERRPISLGLVIDRSGSMAGAKLEFAKAAAKFAVANLLPRDRIAVVVFDSEPRVLCSLRQPADPEIVRAIDSLQTGSTTALHAGWVMGCDEVGRHQRSGDINRVLLLSDGLANGETHPTAIAREVGVRRDANLQTSTMGVGDDYDDALLEGMAVAGGGNFYHIQSPRQLPDFFATELQELSSIVASNLTLELKPSVGVEILDMFNDFDTTMAGAWRLPSIAAGLPLKVLLRLQVPAGPDLGDDAVLGTIRLGWQRPGDTVRHEQISALRVPVLSSASLEQLPLDEEVRELSALLMAQRYKREVIWATSTGRPEHARTLLGRSSGDLRSSPLTPGIARRGDVGHWSDALRQIRRVLAMSQTQSTSKETAFLVYNRIKKNAPELFY